MRKFSLTKPNQNQNKSQNEPIIEDLSFSSEEIPIDNNNVDSGEFTLASLWQNICLEEDIIIIIDRIDELRVRKQLSSLKAKENAKMKSAGIKPDDTTLEFIEHKDFPEKDKIKLQVILKHKPTVKVHKLIIAKD